MTRPLVRLLLLVTLTGCLSESEGLAVDPPDAGPRPDTGVRWGDAGELLEDSCPASYTRADGCSGSVGVGSRESFAVTCDRAGKCFAVTLQRADGGWTVREVGVGRGTCPRPGEVPAAFTGSVGVVETPKGLICAASLDGVARFVFGDGGVEEVELKAADFLVTTLDE